MALTPAPPSIDVDTSLIATIKPGRPTAFDASRPFGLMLRARFNQVEAIRSALAGVLSYVQSGGLYVKPASGIPASDLEQAVRDRLAALPTTGTGSTNPELLPSGSTITVARRAGAWPARPTARGDVVVVWIGPDPAPATVATGTAGMRSGVDVRLVATAVGADIPVVPPTTDPPVTPPTTGAGSEARTLLPFAETSVWRLPAASSPVLAATTDARNVAIRDVAGDAGGYGKVWVNDTNYSHPLSYASAGDPLATVTDTVHTSASGIPAGGSWQTVIPATARIADGDDKHMHVVTPDRRQVIEHFYAARQSPTAYTCARRAVVDLDGSGIGPQRGTRAYGGSAIGGLIRAWEVDPADPRYTGKISHALAVALRPDQLFFDAPRWAAEPAGSDPKQRYGYLTTGTLADKPRPGWPADTPAAGFMWQPGYVWPATEQDYDSPQSYTGAIPMGSYFVIPEDVDITALGLDPAGLMVARAAQDYGVYVTDRAGVSALYVENTPSGSAARAFAGQLINSGGQYKARDVRRIFMALRAVTSNAPATPNGVELGGPRRLLAPTPPTGGGTTTPPVTPTTPADTYEGTLYDTFTAPDATRWAGFSDAAPRVYVDNGAAVITCSPAYAKLRSTATWDLSAGAITVGVTALPAAGNGTTLASMELAAGGPGDRLVFGRLATGMVLETYVGGQRQGDKLSAGYDNATTAWRARRAGAQLVFETSTNGTTFTQRFTVDATIIATGKLSLYLGSGYYGTEPNAGSARFSYVAATATLSSTMARLSMNSAGQIVLPGPVTADPPPPVTPPVTPPPTTGEGTAWRPYVHQPGGIGSAVSLKWGNASGARCKLNGVNVWGLPVYDQTHASHAQFMYDNRVAAMDKIKAMGANLIRLRVDAIVKAYNEGSWGVSQAQVLNRVQAWVDLATARGMVTMICNWDAYNMAGNWGNTYTQSFALFSALVDRLGKDNPYVIYEFANEPNNLEQFQAGWNTAVRGTISYFRDTKGYTGPLVVDPTGWAHNYSDDVFTQIEQHDASRGVMAGKHQLIWARHDYGNEFPGNNWDRNKWFNETGGNQNDHLIFETEYGKYNIDTLSSDGWTRGASAYFSGQGYTERANHVGAVAFLAGPWRDNGTIGNGMTTDGSVTNLTPWGDVVDQVLLTPAAVEGTPAITQNTGGGTTTPTPTPPTSGRPDVTRLWKPTKAVTEQKNAHPEIAPLDQPGQTQWITGDYDLAKIAGFRTQAGDKTMVLSMYAIPGRDNGLYSAGGYPNRDAYLTFLRGIRDRIATQPCILILEADALGLSRDLGATQKAERIETLRQAVGVFAAASATTDTYVDASMWVPAAEQADLLRSIDITKIAGFAINTSNFHDQNSCTTYGDNVVRELAARGLGGKKYVVDTARNGAGELQRSFPGSAVWFDQGRTWCNPPGRRLGLSSGSRDAAHPNMAACLWVKGLGESDGNFPNQGQSNYYGASAPDAGQFWLPYARDLLGRNPSTGQ